MYGKAGARRLARFWVGYCLGGLLWSAMAAHPACAGNLAADLAALAPKADPAVIRLALEAAACAGGDLGATGRIAVIDYSKPSTAERLWVFDLNRRRLLYQERVTHGRNSGENYAQSFSNQSHSKKSSLGLFRTGEAYYGSKGYSLRLYGLEPGVNDRAFERAIIIHGAPYAGAAVINALGRLGRSWGCPVVRPEAARRLIDEMKDGQLVFAYYPDPDWLKSSAFLHCAPPDCLWPNSLRIAPSGSTATKSGKPIRSR